MIQIRLHGRGGQGVVSAAELIALAAFKDGYFAQAFPFFGVERSGAPIEAYVRIGKEPIITREHIYAPDYLIVQDKTLLKEQEIFQGINNSSRLIINSDETAEKMKIFLPKIIKKNNISYIPASAMADNLFPRNLANTVIVGAFAKRSGIITQKSLLAAVAEKFEDKGNKIVKANQQAVITAFEYEEKHR